MNNQTQRIRYLTDTTLPEELLSLGQLDDRAFAVALAALPETRYRDLCNACGIDPCFERARVQLREWVTQLARRNTTFTQEAA